jgi:hypothetical protein
MKDELNSAKQYFLNGLFWQEIAGVGLGGYEPKIGAVAMIHRGTTQFLFAGGFGYDLDELDFRGQMLDEHGRSLMYDITLSKGVLRFYKLYERHRGNKNYALKYELRAQPNGSWAGSYTLINGINGLARCFLNYIDREVLLRDASAFQQEWGARGGRQ